MILNLDVFKEETKDIQLKGKTYIIPKDIPTILYLDLLANSSESPSIGMRKSLEVVHKIFQIHQPDMTLEELGMAITVDQYTAIMNYLIADMDVEETMKVLAEAKLQIKDGKKKPLQAAN